MRLMYAILGVGLVVGFEAGAQVRGVNADGAFGETGDIPGCLVGESFDLQPAYSGFPAGAGEAGNNVFVLSDGEFYRGDPGYGVVDNAAAISSATYNGPAGGPDPLGVRGGMLHIQRASLGEGSNPGFEVVFEIQSDTYAATPGSAVLVTFDVYKGKHADLQWFDMSGFTQLQRFIGGGYYDTGDPSHGLASLRGNPDLSEGIMMFGTVPPLGSGSRKFFLGAKDIAENSWYTLGFLISIDSVGAPRLTTWLRDDETQGVGGGPVTRTPIRTSGPFSGMRMFEEYGHGLEEGWAQLMPGTEDDPATVDTIEGYGLATSTDLEPAPFADDGFGNRVEFAPTVGKWYRSMRARAGGDPTEVQLPGYAIGDWWVDNYCVQGGRRWPIEYQGSCMADLNVDATVDSADLAELLANWGAVGLPEYFYLWDFDVNNVVDSGDLATFLAAWGACP